MTRFFRVSLSGMAVLCSFAAQAESMRIESESDFYRAYGNDFTPEARKTIHSLYKYIAPYMGEGGLQRAIADGFIPFTPEWRYHGFHWFHPQHMLAPSDPTRPPGFNFDENGRLVAVFWSAPSWVPIIYKFNMNQFVRLPLSTQEIAHRNLRFAFPLPEPSNFSMFGDLAKWHSHEFVIVENMGARDANGNLDSQIVNFRQALTPANFARALATSVLSEDITVALIEPNSPALPYPHFNRGVFPGFHMMHFWVGLENADGPFAGTHGEVSVHAVLSEDDTIESGNGHSHHGHGTHQPAPFTPARSVTAGELAALAFQGQLEVANIPAGSHLCVGMRAGAVNARQIAESGFLLGKLAWNRINDTYTNDVGTNLTKLCAN